MVDADTRAAVAGEFVKLVLDFRLVAVLLTLIWLRVAAPSSPVAVALVLAVGLTSFVALLRWARIGRLVARHPAVLAADLVLGLAVLTVVGVESPFAYALLGTALLAGVLYGYVGAGVFGVLLVACHEAAALGDGEPAGFATVITMPALYPAAAFAAAAIGRLIIERSVAVQRAASVETRTAVARDLHDTLAKTVQGLHFTAAALESAAASGDTEAVHRHAGALRGAASRAEREARSLMKNWRIDRGGHPASLADVLATAVRECVAGGGLLVDVDCRPDISGVDPATRRELELVVREAVRNVVAHANATRAQVRVIADPGDGAIRLSVADDGVGLPSSECLAAAAEAGHYGLVGMAERVRRLGGTLELGESALGGAGLWVELPARQPSPVPPEREVAV